MKKYEESSYTYIAYKRAIRPNPAYFIIITNHSPTLAFLMYCWTAALYSSALSFHKTWIAFSL